MLWYRCKPTLLQSTFNVTQGKIQNKQRELIRCTNSITHTSKSVIPGVSSDHCSPIDVLVTPNADTSRPTPIQQSKQT